MIVVVDTSVPVVANNIGAHPPGCVSACARRIREIQASGMLAIDDGWRIMVEYMRNLRSQGQPGIGDAFLKWVLTNQANPNVVEQVHITPYGRSVDDFEEVPHDPGLSGFDPSDRKFIAVAAAHRARPPVLQALDHKWWGFKDLFADCGVTVEFLCPADIEAAYRQRSRGAPGDTQ